MSMTKSAADTEAGRHYRSAGIQFAAVGEKQDVARTIATPEGPVVTVYLPIAAAGEGDEHLARHLHWRTLADRLAIAGASPRTLHDLEGRVMAAPTGTGTLALFTDATGKLAYRMIMRDRGHTGPELAEYAAPARLRPLLAWQHRSMAYVFVAVDRVGADITSTIGRGAAPIVQTVTGPDDEIERNAPGGWEGLAQGRYQHRAEDSWAHNMAHVAKVVRATADFCSAEMVIISGDVRAVQLLRPHLSGLHKWTLAEVPGARSGAGVQAMRDQRITEMLAEADASRLDWLLHRFEDGLAPGGPSVEGVGATLAALRADRVEVLLVSDSAEPTRQAWFGRRGEQIYADAPTTGGHAFNEPRRRGPLLDVAVRSALLIGARVRVVSRDEPRLPAEGIGALCRWT